ncbi:MAG TPA: tannase/feruloyl esterase family alpha/beta hydrolase [Rhizobacter sp.]|nr:tannase/feruloyl esterase family alpha/beta hydrolase [Rhizobacter sp.]
MLTRLALASLTLLPLVACVGKGPLQEAKPADACGELVMPVQARLIQLPTGGAVMSSATLMAASASAPGASPTPTPATPEHCQVLGRIVSADPSEAPVLFQVNLPTQWNGRAVQYGGGANGALVSGLEQPPAALYDAATPLSQGYATFGSDAGSQSAPAEPAHKMVRDVAFQLAIRAYGHGPQKVYFIGGSESGREGLAMAQRYPNDYDGIVSGVRSASAPVDPAQPDLMAFQKRGGKLLMLERAATAAPGPLYYDSAVAQFGQAKVDGFLRVYAAPGAAPSARVDLLGPMAAWVEHAEAPGALTLVEQEPAPPFRTLSTQPLCAWPLHVSECKP